MSEPPRSSVDSFFKGLRLLGTESPRMFWPIIMIKFVESMSWFMVSVILKTYMTDVFGFSDIAAGMHFGARGLLTTVIGLILGPVVDYVGVRNSLLAGLVVLLGSRALLALATAQWVVLLQVYFLNPVGNALALPVTSIQIKRVTTPRTKKVAYALMLVTMNLGWAFAGVVVDVVRQRFYHGRFGELHKPLFRQMSCYRVIIFISTGLTALTMIMSLVAVWDVEADPQTGKCAPYKNPNRDKKRAGGAAGPIRRLCCGKAPKPGGGGKASPEAKAAMAAARVAGAAVAAKGGAPREAVDAAYTAAKAQGASEEDAIMAKSQVAAKNDSMTFWRYAVFVLCLLGVRSLLSHLKATFPQYMEREFGETINYGIIIGLNPVLVSLKGGLCPPGGGVV